MNAYASLHDDQFPLSSKYDVSWVVEHAIGGAHPLWLPEWLSSEIEFQPGMRVLDLGCGNAFSSIFLAKEFGLQVWATDLWRKPTENWRQITDTGLAVQVFPIHADARSLPYAREFFDAIVCIDSYQYFGTDDTFLPYFLSFLKPGGTIGIASAGLMREFEDGVPDHLQQWWEPGLWCLHTHEWWRHLWERTGLVDITVADTMPDGWRHWLRWYKVKWPKGSDVIDALEADSGRYLGYVRVAARKRLDARPLEYDPQTGY